MFELNEKKIEKLIDKIKIPRIKDIEKLCASIDIRDLSDEEVCILVKSIYSADYKAIKQIVLQTAQAIRKKIHGNTVVLMAPVEVTNYCASNCYFCGWRSDNREMKRIRLCNELVLKQAEYLLKKRIDYIEFVGGDDVFFVREDLPTLLHALNEMSLGEIEGKPKAMFCTMALTRLQYERLKSAGAYSMIVWQETYDRVLYEKYITNGFKAYGIDDNYAPVKNGDGYHFRLTSQDRALQAGLGVAIGTMLGLNPNIAFEMIATISHARHLLSQYPIDKQNPVIIGMPIWNHITTRRTDNLTRKIIDMNDVFSFFAAIYFLALDKEKVWVFPNCRVPMAVQVESLLSGGVFSSTEVKVGPGGYLKSLVADMPAYEQSLVCDLLRKNLHLDDTITLEQILSDLDIMEQFCHFYGTHEDYIQAFQRAGLFSLSDQPVSSSYA